jgi:hypothetical protein
MYSHFYQNGNLHYVAFFFCYCFSFREEVCEVDPCYELFCF